MDGDVSASATATPPAAPDTTSTAPAIAPQLDSAPATTGATLNNLPATANPAAKAQAESWGTKVYHGVLNALGGSSDVSLARDPQTGKMVATAVKSGPGQQWKRIISGALTGAAAGNAAEPGRGFGAGEQAVVQRRQANADRQRQQANEDFEVQQKTTVANAQNALLSHQIAQAIYNAGRAKIEAAAGDAQRETDFEKLITDGGAGSTDMGIFPDFDSVMKHFKEMPEMHDHQAGGRIAVIPHINDGGMIDGVHAALVTPTWQQQKYPNAFPITQRVPQPGGGFKEETYTIPPNSYDNDTIAKMVMSQAASSLKDSLDQAEEKDRQARERDLERRTPAENAKDESEVLLNQAKTAAETAGGAVDWGPGGQKGFNSWHDKNVTPALQAERTYRLASNVYNEYRQLRAQGKDFPTGAQSVQMLSYHMANTFGAVKGARITKDMIQQHMGARSVSDAALVAIQNLTSGGKLSPKQWDAYFSMVGQNRDETWRGVLDDANSLGRPNDYIAYPQDLRQSWGLGPGHVNLTQPPETQQPAAAARPQQGGPTVQPKPAGPTTVTIPPGLAVSKTAPVGTAGKYNYGGQNYWVKADGTPLAKAE